MNIQIITSSYPAYEGDPGGTAGLFVQSFAKELVAQGHNVVVQPVGRKQSYASCSGIKVQPMPWQGGDQELASMNYLNPFNWFTLLKFFSEGRKNTLYVHQQFQIDRVLCMWIVPSGLFGYWIHKNVHTPYDTWALGSDIWKIRKIPFLGKYLIKKIINHAQGIFADGIGLSQDVKSITAKACAFLPSIRTLPQPEQDLPPLLPRDACHLLFVGRYHYNKGPDLLIDAISILENDIQKKLKIHFFGAGPLEKTLKQTCLSRQLGQTISINGPIDAQNCSNMLSQVSFLVIPSRIESIPLVFSDAMQIKTPVICTPVGDLPELIKQNQCGVVSKNISAQALASSIKSILNTNSSCFKDSTAVLKQFSIKSSVSSWLNHKKSL